MLKPKKGLSNFETTFVAFLSLNISLSALSNLLNCFPCTVTKYLPPIHSLNPLQPPCIRHCPLKVYVCVFILLYCFFILYRTQYWIYFMDTTVLWFVSETISTLNQKLACHHHPDCVTCDIYLTWTNPYWDCSWNHRGRSTTNSQPAWVCTDRW